MQKRSLKYRPEIDGLRAIAVIPVILFHAGFDLFNGGFIGVDIFFVISGYLITTIILEDIENNRFSIVNFYERRARRILPALFFVIICFIPFAWMLMLQSQFMGFSQSLVAVCLFASNILFWRESDYFDSSSDLKPLLHTWSLAVEEQYYVFFPIIVTLLWKFGKNRVFWLLVASAGASLLLSEWGWRNKADANFYLAPTRAWELLAGSVAAFVVRKHGIVSNNLLALAGLMSILISIHVFNTKTPTPSIYTLLPICGVVLIIMFAGRRTFVAKLLSVRMFVGVGLISYSLYLWHHPIFAFARIISLDEPSKRLLFMLIGIIFVLAYISWRYVEQPFRKKHSFNRKKIFTLSFLMLGFVTFLGLLGQTDRFLLTSGRFNPFYIKMPNYEQDNKKLKVDSWNILREISNEAKYGVENNEFDEKLWYSNQEIKEKLLIVGNSHSKDLFNVLNSSRTTKQRFEIARYGVQIGDLNEGHSFFYSPNFQSSDAVILATAYSFEDVDNLKWLIEKLLRSGKKVTVVKNMFRFDRYRYGIWSLIDKLVYEQSLFTKNKEEIFSKVNSEYFSFYNVGEEHYCKVLKETNHLIENIVKEFDGVKLLDRMEYVCDRKSGIFYAVNESLEKYFYDGHHHTLKGADFFGKRIDQIDWLEINRDYPRRVIPHCDWSGEGKGD